MKRYFSVVIFLSSVILLFFLISMKQEKFVYSGLVHTTDDIGQLKSERNKAVTNLLSAIYFNDYPLFYDELTGRWFYSVSPGEPVLDPVIRFSSNTREEVRIAFSGIISPGETIPFIAYTREEYSEYELAVTTLPMIRIEGYDESLLLLQNRVKFTLFDNRPSVNQRIVTSEGWFHIRGHGSVEYDKRSYRLTLLAKGPKRDSQENQTSILGLRPDGDWLLYAGYNDQEKIRNVFSSNLWLNSCGDDNSFGIRNGNEYRFVELFLDKKYWGLYAIGYPIDGRQMNILPGASGRYNEYLFKQSLWGPYPEYTNPERDNLVFQFAADEEDIEAGYRLLKTYYDHIYNGAPNGLMYNDKDNALDIWLYLNLIQAEDSVKKEWDLVNNLIYAIKNSKEGIKILYTPWDMDRAWGNMFGYEYPNTTSPYALDPNDNGYIMKLNPVTVLQTQSSEINRQIKRRYAELRADQWSEEVIGDMLNQFEDDIYHSGAYLREMERWPDGSYQDPSIGLSKFREYVFTRLKSLDGFIESLPISE